MSDGEWVLSWRVVLTREWGWPGQRVLAFDVPSVEDLRAVVLRARRDPAIASYTVLAAAPLAWPASQPRAVR